jgi:hypothetical protein
MNMLSASPSNGVGFLGFKFGFLRGLTWGLQPYRIKILMWLWAWFRQLFGAVSVRLGLWVVLWGLFG